ncbi:MAG: DUF2397 family protein [Steroidobacteraceae bacterium]
MIASRNGPIDQSWIRFESPGGITSTKAPSMRSSRRRLAAAPGNADAESRALSLRLSAWQERWTGLREWFVPGARKSSQAELLRASALAAIPRLLQAISILNERRAGRSDRGNDSAE